MGDLIDRQAAIDAADKIIERDTSGSNAVVNAMIAWSEYIKTLPSAQPIQTASNYLQSLPTSPLLVGKMSSAQSEPQWIPCSERLPEYNQICIVTDETRRHTYEYGFHDETYDEESGWTYMGHKIIAWMPLPEPYKGKE